MEISQQLFIEIGLVSRLLSIVDHGLRHERLEQGDAQYQLGMLYNKGQGVPRDYVLAYMWLNLSASQAVGEDQDFKSRMRDAIAMKMTERQVRTAQIMAVDLYHSR